MSTRSLIASPTRRSPRSRAAAIVLVLLATTACSEPQAAKAQQVVFDPKNHVENALQATRQLESLSNEARQLASSPYSHLNETTGTLREIGELARSVKGVATDVEGIQRDFDDLYPTAVKGLDPKRALEQAQGRSAKARETAQDLARTAAELERLAQARPGRIQGALNASQNAAGTTAAIQSSTQVLAVLSEDLGSLRTILLAQSRMLAAAEAQRTADRAAGAEARRQFWGNQGSTPANPDFNPYSRAKN